MVAARGRVFKPKEVVEFEEMVSWLARSAFAPNKPHQGRVEVHIVYDHLENQAKVTVELHDEAKVKRRRKDIQNLPDTILDAMNGVIYLDDAQVELISVRLGKVS